MSLLDVSNRLRNEKVVRAFRERAVSTRRIFVTFAALIWSIAWSLQRSNDFMRQEALQVIPVAAVLAGLALLWAVYVRTSVSKHAAWPDAVGSVSDMVGIGLLIHFGWNVMLPLVPLMPLIAIGVGARYSKREFWYAVGASALILAVSAPPGYWASRPVVAVLALSIVVGLPMTVYRVLSAIRLISQEAIEARETQNRFFAMMSHDLRTPLNTIINATSLLEGEKVDPSQRELYNLISANADTLLARINDVLDVAAIKADQMEPVIGVFSMQEVLDSLYSGFRGPADRKQLTFSLSLMPEADWPQVMGDRRRVHQVISNLVGNAIKYTPERGQVTIIGRMDTPSEEETEFVLEVIDTGIGIPDSAKSAVFEPFTQTSSGRTRASDGVGLGLYIAKSISDRLGGTLNLQDNPSGGAVFTWRISLPIATQTQINTGPEDIATTIERHTQSHRSIKALIIDDNASNRKILGRILARAGHTPDYASSGQEGIERLQDRDFDIAFLDMHMPGMAGDEVLSIIRGLRQQRQLPPIIVVSADASTSAREAAMAMGADAFIIKPIAIPSILGAIEKHT